SRPTIYSAPPETVAPSSISLFNYQRAEFAGPSVMFILRLSFVSSSMEMFYYTVDAGRLAGLPGPAYMEWDFARLRKMGYSVVVSLACDHLNTFELEDAGFEHKKICVEDFTAPTLDQVDEFVAFVDSKIAEGKK